MESIILTHYKIYLSPTERTDLLFKITSSGTFQYFAKFQLKCQSELLELINPNDQSENLIAEHIAKITGDQLLFEMWFDSM